MRKRLPATPDEWQMAVDLARGALALDSARGYGLVTGGPKVNVGRCEEILNMGMARGVMPSADAIENFVACLQHEQDPH